MLPEGLLYPTSTLI